MRCCSQLRAQRLEAERAQLQSQVEWLEKQLRDKSSELFTLRAETTGKLLDIKSQLELKCEEARQSQVDVDQLKTTCSEQSKRLQTLNAELEKVTQRQYLLTALNSMYSHEFCTDTAISLYSSILSYRIFSFSH